MKQIRELLIRIRYWFCGIRSMLYWYGLLPVLVAQVVFPEFANEYLIGGSYLILGLLILIVPKFFKR